MQNNLKPNNMTLMLVANDNR